MSIFAVSNSGYYFEVKDHVIVDDLIESGAKVFETLYEMQTYLSANFNLDFEETDGFEIVIENGYATCESIWRPQKVNNIVEFISNYIL